MNAVFHALSFIFVVHRLDERRFPCSLTHFCRSSAG
jgi:hypothetical protein